MSTGIRKRFLLDLSFIAISKYSNIFIGLLISAVLARLLSPDDYGVIGLATIFSMFFGLFSSMGIAPAIIQNQDLTKDDISDIFGFTFWLGLILGGFFFLSSGWIADFYDKQVLRPICQWLSLSLFLGTLGMIPEALLSKKKMFKFLAVRNVTFQIIGGIISIILAFRGFGVYTLVISPLFTSIMNFTVNTYNVKQSFHLFPSLTPMKKIFNFSAFQFLFNIINYFGNNFASLLIGKVLSVASIGYFNKATSVINLPVSNITGVITPVLFPYLTDMQNDFPRLFSVFQRLNLLLVTLAFPIAAVLCMCANEIILILYGPQWTAVVSCFSILTITAAMQIASVSTASCIQAIGKTQFLFWLGTFNTIISLIGLSCGVFYFRSIEGVALMSAISSTWAAIFSIVIIYKRVFHEATKSYFSYALRPVFFYIAMIGCSFAFDQLANVHFVVSGVVKFIFWICSYFIFLKKITPYDPKKYISIILSRIRNR